MRPRCAGSRPWHPAIVDLNCGCSVPKVLKADCGALLLRNPALIGSIVAAMKSETDIPVSVKLRLGWEASSLTYLACAEAAVKAGASLVTLHPRTRAQGFSGTAQWNHLRILKEACPVPVIGSGDLFSAQDCMKMIATTGCDGVMVARGCLGNPFIFAQAEALLKGEPAQMRIEPGERLSLAISHLRLLADSVGETRRAATCGNTSSPTRRGWRGAPSSGRASCTRPTSTSTKRSWRATCGIAVRGRVPLLG